MSLTKITAFEALSHLASFDAVIDVRSPSEFALDHLPNALNWPALSDEERIRVGTIYKQIGSFEAKKIGGALVARNIAHHIETHCITHTKNWKPLIYCWRGGKRSHSLALVLGQIGFDVHLIEGGYKAFRSEMLKHLEQLTSQLDYRVVCGSTGSGKTRLLHALKVTGAQVLDLEDLAHHKSSVLGVIPGTQQPSQKHYDMLIWQTLHRFNCALPVFVEAESKKVGNISVPDCVINAMRRGQCIRLDMPMSSRISLLLEDYDYFVKNIEFFCSRLEVLIPFRGATTVRRWQQQAKSGTIAPVIQGLLQEHYDPSYLKSISRNFKHYENALTYYLNDHHTKTFTQLAQTITQPSTFQLNAQDESCRSTQKVDESKGLLVDAPPNNHT